MDWIGLGLKKTHICNSGTRWGKSAFSAAESSPYITPFPVPSTWKADGAIVAGVERKHGRRVQIRHIVAVDRMINGRKADHPASARHLEAIDHRQTYRVAPKIVIVIIIIIIIIIQCYNVIVVLGIPSPTQTLRMICSRFSIFC